MPTQRFLELCLRSMCVCRLRVVCFVLKYEELNHVLHTYVCVPYRVP